MVFAFAPALKTNSFLVLCLLTIVDKSGMIKFKTEFQGFPYRIDTSGLPEGLYFVNIIHKGKTSTIKLIVKHP